MAATHQYTYLLATGFVAAFVDAWNIGMISSISENKRGFAYNIGANDVSNIFATSVASRSLTMKQAMIIGSVMNFAGAVGAGYAFPEFNLFTILIGKQGSSCRHHSEQGHGYPCIFRQSIRPHARERQRSHRLLAEHDVLHLAWAACFYHVSCSILRSKIC